MAQQVRNLLWECEDLGIQPRFLIHDRDVCFCWDFDDVLRSAGVEPVKSPYHAPNAKGYASYCTSFVRFGVTSAKRRRSESFEPCFLAGGLSPGCS